MADGSRVMPDAPLHQPSEWKKTLFEPPDSYHMSPDSGELQYKSRGLEKAI
jgi:hypothetical protein